MLNAIVFIKKLKNNTPAFRKNTESDSKITTVAARPKAENYTMYSRPSAKLRALCMKCAQ